MPRSLLRQVQRDAYLVSRTAGDVNAAKTGGAPRLAKRLVRRRWRRFIGRKTGGWL
jgi:hypothetical protein